MTHGESQATQRQLNKQLHSERRGLMPPKAKSFRAMMDKFSMELKWLEEARCHPDNLATT